MLENHTPHFEAVDKMSVPKLLVWGRHDRVLSFTYGQQIKTLVPSTLFEVFEHSGHLPHFEEPEKFNAIMEKFLRKESTQEI
jgi:pimeloyl-ACP methyl ester carboxylesterase